MPWAGSWALITKAFAIVIIFLGVAADLRRCLAEWESHSRIDPFPLGAHDASDRLLMPERLYGREREIDTLLVAFDRVVATGTPELVLVSGYSGHRQVLNS